MLPIPSNALRFYPLVPSSHPHLLISLNGSALPTQELGCSLQLSFDLPDALFLDPDEPRDLWPDRFVSSWDLIPDVIDIERPVRDGEPVSNLALVLPHIAPDEIMTLDIPLHARYLEPRESGQAVISLFDRKGSYRGGVICSSEDKSVPSSGHLSEIHVEPLSVTLPTGIPSHQSKVEFTTTGVIWLGFFYLVYKVVRLGQRMDKAKSNVAKTKVS